MRASAALATLLAVVLSGCLFGPEPEQEVASRRDHFELREFLHDRSGLEAHAWQNSGERARVAMEADTGQGSVKVSLFDDLGLEVYTQTFASDTAGSVIETSPGSPGNWTIRLLYAHAVGNLRLVADAVKETEESG